MKPLRITGVRATTVTVPLAAPLRHAAGYPYDRDSGRPGRPDWYPMVPNRIGRIRPMSVRCRG